MKSYGFGIIGCGMIANFHAKAISEIEGARLVVTCSRNETSAQRLANEYSAEWYTDYREMLKRDDVDIVNICTPSGAHLEIACKAALAGKHVIIEKPMEITLERIDSIIDACSRHKVKLGVVFPSRFGEASRLVKEAVSKGRLGRLTLADAYVKWFRSQSYYDTGGWKGTWKLDGGGALMNQSIHAIDLLQWFAGPVKSVCAMTDRLAHKNIEVEDTAVAVLRFRNGALGCIEGATSVYPGFLKKIEISGERGSIIMEEEDILSWQFAEEEDDDIKIRETFKARRSGGGGASDPRAISYTGHKRQFEDFIESIEQGREPLVDGIEGRKSVEIILAIYKSSKEGRCVNLPMSI